LNHFEQSDRVYGQIFTPARVIPPRLPKVLPRPHLIKRLGENDDKRVIFLIAQAAQGKTTLASLYAAGKSAAWVNLRPEDSDAAELFRIIVWSLDRALTDIDIHGLYAYVASSTTPRDERFIFRDWADALGAHVREPVRLIIDGLDRIDPGASGMGLLATLLDDCGPNMSFLIASRGFPPFDLSQLKIRQELHLITNEEIAFVREETVEFVRDIKKLDLNATQIKKLHGATEGWAGGLVLICELLGGMPAEAQASFISGELGDRYRQEVFPYFGSQIMAAQPAPVQDFLMRTAHLEFLDPEFLQEFLPGEDTAAILKELVKKNLFVHSIHDQKKGMIFRYHQMFRDFLQGRFRNVSDLRERCELHMKTATLYEQRGDPEEAIRHFLAAGEHPRAIALMERIGTELLRSGRSAEVSLWLATLPADDINGNPWLLLYKYLTTRFSGGPPTAKFLHRAFLMFSERRDRQGLLLATAYLIEAYFFGGFHAVPLDDLLVGGEALLASLLEDDYPYEQARLWLQLGIGYGHGTGRIRKALVAFENARLTGMRSQDVYIQIQSLLHASSDLKTLGETAAALDRIQGADRLLARYDYPELKVQSLVEWASLRLTMGETERCLPLIRKAVALAEGSGLVLLLPMIRSYEFYIEICLEHHREAEDIGRAMLDFHASMNSQMPWGITAIFLAMNALNQGNLAEAAELAEKGVAVLASRSGSGGAHLQGGMILCGRIRSALGDYSGAEKMLIPVLEHALREEWSELQVECGFELALLSRAKGQIEDACQHLRSALLIAAGRNFPSLFYISKRHFADLLALAIELDVAEGREYVLQMLSNRLAPHAGPALECLGHHRDGKIRQQAHEIRQRIHRNNRPVIRIETLGHFRVFVGGRTVDEDGWGGNMPKQLLKVLITRGAAGAPRDLIMEDLWPEASGSSGDRNFKVTLHRLRRLMEPDADSAFGYTYVHLKDNNLSLDRELCQTDVEEFVSLCHAGRAAEKRGEVKDAITAYVRAADLYMGDFLPDDLYLPWAVERREVLRRHYLEILAKTADLSEESGSLKKAIACHHRIIESDPVCEDSCRKLMQLYSRRGMQSAALKVYEQCRKTLREELSTDPSETTTAIYRKLLNSP
jgi:ATP/maltotriose-dependent transcriptional regulator MalT/DNA-binding SARP family transcriptional activator